MDDPREQSPNLHEMLIEDGHRGELTELNQPANASENDLGRGILGDVIVGSGFKAGDDVGVIIPDGQH